MSTYTTIPSEVVSQLVLAHPATRDDLHAIRDRHDPSRYIGTYHQTHGGRYNSPGFRARVLKFVELGSGFDTREDAARAVVGFYKAHFGTDWLRAFWSRKKNPWRLRTVRRESGTVYAADIFLRGTPVGVTHADAYGRKSGASESWYWPTEDAAKDAARRAMSRRFERERAGLVVPHPGLIFWRG